MLGKVSFVKLKFILKLMQLWTYITVTITLLYLGSLLILVRGKEESERRRIKT